MNCLDLFRGCGGFSLGFQRAGIEVLAAIDHWQEALTIYRANFDHDAILHDLTDEVGAIKII